MCVAHTHEPNPLKYCAYGRTGEHETGRGINQIGTLHRAGATRWSSHFDSICSLIDMYEATMTVLNNIIDEASWKLKVHCVL